MKKIKTGAICLLTISLLTGCSQSAPLIKSYTDTALNSKSLIINTSTENAFTHFLLRIWLFSLKTRVLSAVQTIQPRPMKHKPIHRNLKQTKQKKVLLIQKPNRKRRRLMKHPKV